MTRNIGTDLEDRLRGALREVAAHAAERASSTASSTEQRISAGQGRPGASRQKRRFVVAAVAAAACLMVLGPWGVRMLADLPGDSMSDSASGGSASEYRVADGYRGVGALGLIFEVPESWSDGDVACDGSPRSDTVVFGSGALCRVLNPPKVSSLRILPTGDQVAASAVAAARASEVVDVGGVRVRVSPVQQLEDGAWTFSVLDEHDDLGDLVVIATSQDKGVVDRIRNTLREVPAGWVVVPDLRLATVDDGSARLRDMGLDVSVRDQDAPGHKPGSIVSTDPLMGSVVKHGSTVTINRAVRE